MKLRRRETRSEGETIVAMIDVVFFLLVFFMLVGRMDATAPFALEIPLAEGGAPLPHGGAIISLAVDGRLAFDGDPVEEQVLVDRLAESGETRLRLQADAGAPLETVLPVLDSLRAAMEAAPTYLPGSEPSVVLVVTPRPETP